MKGRKPYPIEVLKATNDSYHMTKAELRERKNNQPTISHATLRCPPHLSDEAAKEWRRIVRLYRDLSDSIITDLDVNALEVYCEAVVTYRKAMQKVHETSAVVTNKTDPNKPKKNPWLTVANEAAGQMKKYSEILLLDPVSRARASLPTKQQGKGSPMQEFLKRRGINA